MKSKIDIPIREGKPTACIACGAKLSPKSEFYCSLHCYRVYNTPDESEKPLFFSKWKLRKKKETQDPLIKVRKKVRTKTNALLKQGKLKKSLCVACQSPDVVPHHEDYVNPFRVIWLCEEHHKAYHDGKIALFNGTLRWNSERLIPKDYQGAYPVKKYRAHKAIPVKCGK